MLNQIELASTFFNNLQQQILLRDNSDFKRDFKITQRQRWRELNTVCYAVQMTFFKSARDLLLVGVQEGLLDEGVFITTRS